MYETSCLPVHDKWLDQILLPTAWSSLKEGRRWRVFSLRREILLIREQHELKVTELMWNVVFEVFPPKSWLQAGYWDSTLQIASTNSRGVSNFSPFYLKDFKFLFFSQNLSECFYSWHRLYTGSRFSVLSLSSTKSSVYLMGFCSRIWDVYYLRGNWDSTRNLVEMKS